MGGHQIGGDPDGQVKVTVIGDPDLDLDTAGIHPAGVDHRASPDEGVWDGDVSVVGLHELGCHDADRGDRPGDALDLDELALIDGAESRHPDPGGQVGDGVLEAEAEDEPYHRREPEHHRGDIDPERREDNQDEDHVEQDREKADKKLDDQFGQVRSAGECLCEGRDEHSHNDPPNHGDDNGEKNRFKRNVRERNGSSVENIYDLHVLKCGTGGQIILHPRMGKRRGSVAIATSAPPSQGLTGERQDLRSARAHRAGVVVIANLYFEREHRHNPAAGCRRPVYRKPGG